MKYIKKTSNEQFRDNVAFVCKKMAKNCLSNKKKHY